MKKLFLFSMALTFLFLFNMKFCFSEVDYNIGVDFSNLKDKIELGQIKHIKKVNEYENEVSPISWKIIDKKNNDLFMISECALDYIQYSGKNSSEWDSSNVKTWIDENLFGCFAGISEKNLSLPYVDNNKVYIDENVELKSEDWVLNTKSGDAKNINWWTKTKYNANMLNAMKFKQGENVYKIGTMGAGGSLYVRPCMTLNLSKVIYFDETNQKFSFVTGKDAEELKNINDDIEISYGENLNLNIENPSQPIAYKIIKDNKLMLYGETNDALIKTSDLNLGNYEIYLWLQDDKTTFNLTSKPKKIKLNVKESKPEFMNVKFSSLAHRKNFEKDICIDIVGKNLKANDVLEIKFLNGGCEEFSKEQIIYRDTDEFSLCIESQEINILSVGNYDLKLNLKRSGQTLIEKKLDYEYVVSDLPVMSQISLSPSSLNISIDRKEIAFDIKLSGMQKNDEVVSGEACIIKEDKIAQTENIITEDNENYFGKIILPSEIIPGIYEFNSRFKIKNDFIADEQIITSQAIKFEISQSKLNMPKSNLKSGKYFSYQQINLTADSGAEIFYTLDGTMPNQNSNKFVEPLKLFSGNYILKAIAFKENYEPSEVLQRDYKIIQSSSPQNDNTYDEFEVKDENGITEQLESQKLDNKIILYPAIENLIELTDKNKFVNLNLESQNDIACKFSQELVSYIAKNLSGLKLSLENIGDVTIKNDIFKNLLGHDFEIELGYLSLNIKSDGKDYTENNFKNNIDVNFKCNADEKIDADNIILLKECGDKREIVIQSYYDKNLKVMKLKTNSGGKFEIGYNKKSFSDTTSKEISYLIARNILNGVGDNKFLPNEKIRQADFLIMLIRSLGISIDENVKNAASSKDKYYDIYVSMAEKLNLIGNKDKYIFEPEKFLTSNQMYTMAKKFFDIKTMDDDNNSIITRLGASKFIYDLLTIDFFKI